MRSPRQIQNNQREAWRSWWYSSGGTRLHDPDYRLKASDSKARLSEPSDAELDRKALKWLEADRG